VAPVAPNPVAPVGPVAPTKFVLAPTHIPLAAITVLAPTERPFLIIKFELVAIYFLFT
jgi:hypothetical protein